MRLSEAALILLTPVCFTGQPQVIPSDAAAVSPAEKHAFLEAICPGHATATGCAACPAEMPASAQTWDLRSIIFGHFLSPQSNDALVAGTGCEDHAHLMSGSYLFVKEDARWRKHWYTPGANANDCKKLTANDGRDLLVCHADDMHQGVADEFLYLMDPGKDPARQEADSPLHLFFDVVDSLPSCSKLADGTLRRGELESVSFLPDAASGGMRIVVDARVGKATVPDQAFEKCVPGERRLQIETVPVRYEFRFDGREIVPDPHNPPTDEYGGAAAPTTTWRLR
ncbi:MAG: hypothetical protein ACLP59_01685 [Bryobacteraceae bacterium]